MIINLISILKALDIVHFNLIIMKSSCALKVNHVLCFGFWNDRKTHKLYITVRNTKFILKKLGTRVFF